MLETFLRLLIIPPNPLTRGDCPQTFFRRALRTYALDDVGNNSLDLFNHLREVYHLPNKSTTKPPSQFYSTNKQIPYPIVLFHHGRHGNALGLLRLSLRESSSRGALRHHSCDCLRQRPSVDGYATQFASLTRPDRFAAGASRSSVNLTTSSQANLRDTEGVYEISLLATRPQFVHNLFRFLSLGFHLETPCRRQI